MNLNLVIVEKFEMKLNKNATAINLKFNITNILTLNMSDNEAISLHKPSFKIQMVIFILMVCVVVSVEELSKISNN